MSVERVKGKDNIVSGRTIAAAAGGESCGVPVTSFRLKVLQIHQKYKYYKD
jgi:hypothetical protein